MRFHFGAASSEVDIPMSRVAGRFHGPRAARAMNVAEEVAKALAEPTSAPPLRQALTPDDHLTIVLDSGLPSPDAFIKPIVACFEELGGQASRVLVLATPSEAPGGESALLERLTAALAGLSVAVHDPEDQSGNAYLASTKMGQRVYLDRRVTDADAVIVVSRSGADPVLGIRGATSSLYPGMSDAAAVRRGQLIATEGGIDADTLRQRQGSDEVAWLLGLFYGLNVALDRADNVEDFWFGEFSHAQGKADERARVAWTAKRPDRPIDLVVAPIAKGSPGTWSRVGAAVENAARIADPSSTIVLITDLADPPGAAARLLVDLENPWELLSKLQGLDAPDILPTSQFAHALASHKIYLHSGLASELVESMGMVPLSGDREIENLARRFESIYLLEDADRALVAPTSVRIRTEGNRGVYR